MSRFSPAVACAVQEALRRQPYLMDSDISYDQGTKLFVDTIRVASASNPTVPVAVVIDGLDETDFKWLKETTGIFSRVLADLPHNAKVFISSRAEDVIRDKFSSHFTNSRIAHIHLSARNSVPEVTRFLERNVKEIMEDHHLEWSQWGQERMKKLCAQASGLFIWAVTAIKYIRAEIEDSGKERLGVVLDELNANGMQDINSLYLRILKRTYRAEKKLWPFQRFRRIMGAILVQRSPLCIADLEGLLDLRNPTGESVDIEHFIRRLRTVMIPSAGEISNRTVPRVHKSFSDFVTSAAAEDFRVDMIDSNGELAIQCVRRLNRLWKFEKPGQLLYAVTHWSCHLTGVVGVKLEVEADGEGAVSAASGENIVSHLENIIGAQAGVEVPDKRQQLVDQPLCVTVSPDGKRIAFALQNGSIQLRDTQTGNAVLAPIVGHMKRVIFVSFSPDGERIVSASGDKTIRIWSTETGNMVLGPLLGHTDEVDCAVFSPDGKYIVSGSDDHTIRIWNSANGDMILGPLEGHTSWVMGAVFSPDGQRIVSASYDGTIRIWNSHNGDSVLGPLKAHTAKVCYAVFSPDGGHIVSCSKDKTILVRNSRTGEIIGGCFGDATESLLSFTDADSETAQYIVTPPRPDLYQRRTFTSTCPYSFHLEEGRVSGVANSNCDTWLYANDEFAMGRYLGQLILLCHFE
jgi:hypothetical protein